MTAVLKLKSGQSLTFRLLFFRRGVQRSPSDAALHEAEELLVIGRNEPQHSGRGPEVGRHQQPNVQEEVQHHRVQLRSRVRVPPHRGAREQDPAHGLQAQVGLFGVDGLRRRRRRRHELVDVEPTRGELPDGPERRLRERTAPDERRASGHHVDVVIDVVAVVVQFFDQLQQQHGHFPEHHRPQAAAEQHRAQRQVRSAELEPGPGEPLGRRRQEQDRHCSRVPDQPRVNLLPGCSNLPGQLSHEEENLI